MLSGSSKAVIDGVRSWTSNSGFPIRIIGYYSAGLDCRNGDASSEITQFAVEYSPGGNRISCDAQLGSPLDRKCYIFCQQAISVSNARASRVPRQVELTAATELEPLFVEIKQVFLVVKCLLKLKKKRAKVVLKRRFGLDAFSSFYSWPTSNLLATGSSKRHLFDDSDRHSDKTRHQRHGHKRTRYYR